MVAKKTKLIEKHTGAGGVSSYVGHSRVRVADIVRMIPWIEEDDVVDSIVRELPTLTHEGVRAAIDYWLTHKCEIDALIAEEEELFRQHAATK